MMVQSVPSTTSHRPTPMHPFQSLVLVLVKLALVDQVTASQAASEASGSSASIIDTNDVSETAVASHVSGVFSAVAVGLLALLAYLALLSYSVLRRRQNTRYQYGSDPTRNSTPPSTSSTQLQNTQALCSSLRSLSVLGKYRAATVYCCAR